jgi:hypothetical protein
VGDVGEKRSSCSSPSIGFYIYGKIAFDFDLSGLGAHLFILYKYEEGEHFV